MYPQFWGMVVRIYDALLGYVHTPAFEEYAKKEMVKKKGSVAEGDVTQLRGEFISFCGSLMLAPAIPLVLYFISLVLLVYGYYVDSGDSVVGGVVMLLVALGFCIGFLCFAFLSNWWYLSKLGFQTTIEGIFEGFKPT